MNRFPAWKYAMIGLTIILAFIYTLPNFYGDSPAVQLSSAKPTVKVDDALASRVEAALKSAGIPYTGLLLDSNSLRIRFADTDTQLKAKDLISKTVNPDPSPTLTRKGLMEVIRLSIAMMEDLIRNKHLLLKPGGISTGALIKPTL